MALKLLQNAYRQLQKEPVEGFCVEPNEANFFEWKIYIEGPTGTPYQGGIFEMEMTFPQNFPMSPPELRFVSEFWHPNVYKDGRVCISILHPPGEDVMSGELPEERWLPTQTVETIVLSVLSIIGDPNFSSPANVDASVQCQHKHAAYVARCRALVEKARVPSHIKIPHPESNPVERQKALERHRILNESTPDDFMMDSDNEYDYDIDYGGDFEDDMSGSDIGFNYDDDDDDDDTEIKDKTSSSTKKKSEKKHTSESKSKPKEAVKKEKEKKSTHKKKDEKKKETEKKPKEHDTEKRSKEHVSDKSGHNGSKSKKDKTEKKEKEKDKSTKSDSTKKSHSSRSPKTGAIEKSKKSTHKSKEKTTTPEAPKETKKKKPSG